MECNGNKKIDGNGNKGGGQATAMATKRAMVTATRVVGNKKAWQQGPMVTRVVGEQRQQE